MDSNDDKKIFFYLKRIAPMGDGKYLIIPFKSPEVVIGRTRGISFTIPDLSISRKHAVFRRKDENNKTTWTVTNLSANGTRIDGKMLPPNKERPLLVASTVEFCSNLQQFVYKFGSKVISSKKRNMTNSSTGSSVDSKVTPSSPCEGGNESTLTAVNNNNNTQLLLQEHNDLEHQLQQHKDKYNELLLEKKELTQSSSLQLEQLQQRYEEERQELQRQVTEEQEKRAMRESEEQLARQLQQQVDALQQRLEVERQELEQMLHLEEQRKQQLQREQEAVSLQMEEEKRSLQAALEEEKGQLKEQMEQQMAEQVKEVEQKLQLRLQQVEENLQEERRAAITLSHELKIQSEAAQRLQVLEGDKAALEAELEEARKQDKQVMQLQEVIEKRDQEKETFQQEMERMECAVSAEAKKSVVDTVEQVMDSEMQCPICGELFIKSVLLNCSHTFCQFCIDRWKKNKKDCPSCRAAIKSETRSLTVDNFIDKIFESLSDQLKKKRMEVIKDREAEVVSQAAAVQAAKDAREAARSTRGRRGAANRRGNRGGGGGGGPSNQTRRGAYQPRGAANVQPVGASAGSSGANQVGPSTVPQVPMTVDQVPITVPSDSSSSDEDEHSHPDSDSSYASGDESVYYGGYGRCFTCGRKGHWATGCPYM